MFLLRWSAPSDGVTRAAGDYPAVCDSGADLRLGAVESDTGALGLDDGPADFPFDQHGVAGADELCAVALVATRMAGGWVSAALVAREAPLFSGWPADGGTVSVHVGLLLGAAVAGPEFQYLRGQADDGVEAPAL